MSAGIGALRAAVLDAAEAIGAGTPNFAPKLERPKQADHGDYATNAAMMLAGVMKAPPREVAEKLAEALRAQLGDQLVSAEVAGPGFLNLVVADAWLVARLAEVLGEGDAYGAGLTPRPRKTNIEFVSVNPTGPLHIGHSRNAAYGDAVARLLEFGGYEVTREYYVNDYGSQVRNFALSIQARARGEEPPEGGYVGEYIDDIAAAIPGSADMDVDELTALGVEAMLELDRKTLDRFHVHFDVFFSEKSLHDEGKVEHAFDVLKTQGRTYESEGALWLRTHEFGDDKDRVLVRSTGEHTYFASDIAYHQDKRERGFELMIDVWGADHHGYVDRVHAGFEALGGAKDDLELIIMQLVKLVEDGVEVKMSKRSGTFVTLDELMDDIGADATRWYLLQRSHDTAMEFDLGLARSQSAENPVFYVQMAHARMASIQARSTVAPSLDGVATLHPSERELIKKLLEFGADVVDAAERRAPHRVCTYALELAQTFSAFYRDCPVIGDPAEASRVALGGATQLVLARCLALLGISAPDSM